MANGRIPVHTIIGGGKNLGPPVPCRVVGIRQVFTCPFDSYKMSGNVLGGRCVTHRKCIGGQVFNDTSRKEVWNVLEVACG